MKRTWLLVLIVIAAALLFSSCVPGDGRHTAQHTAGFFWGVWHGWIAPFSLIMGLFRDGIRVYEVNNSGWWYDFGFYMAIIGGFGGLAFSRSRKTRRYREYRTYRK